jgi:catechol 2,3-dioxygenase-like lactoylglutathione lyase family enzyme
MPVPQHIFYPPFNIIRSSHVGLDVVDLNASREFYEKTIGLHVEDPLAVSGSGPIREPLFVADFTIAD